MNQSSDRPASLAKIKRRSFVLGAAAVGTTQVLADPALRWRAVTPSAEKALLSISHLSESARRVGRKVLLAEPELHHQRRLVSALLAKLELDPAIAPQLGANALRRRAAERVQSDFADEHTIMIDGWVLSATEAWLCALAANAQS